MKHVAEELPEGTELEQNRFLCGRVKQMFDVVFGEGTGDCVCGRGNDLLTCMAVYEQLITEQIRQDNQYNEIMGRLKMLSKGNALVEKMMNLLIEKFPEFFDREWCGVSCKMGFPHCFKMQ